MIRVNNKKVIRRLADGSFRAAKMRNIIAVIAIALTALLFTSIFMLLLGDHVNTSSIQCYGH